MQVDACPSRAVGHRSTPGARESSGEPSSWTAGWGSTCQAPPRVTLVTALSYHAGSDNVVRGAGHGMISLPIDLGGRATSCWNTEWLQRVFAAILWF
jgi:hypothetical protein